MKRNRSKAQLGILLTIFVLFAGTAISEEAHYAFTNRLAGEKNPYLLQHAHNPVNWFPWGEEAFTKARKENKPLPLIHI